MNIKSCRWRRQRNVISVDKHSIVKICGKKGSRRKIFHNDGGVTENIVTKTLGRRP